MLNYFEIIYHLSLLLIFVTGVFAVINDHKSKNNWIYFLFTLSIMGWMSSLYLGWKYVNYAEWDTVLFWMRFAYGFSIPSMSFMTLFLYSFPRPTFDLPKVVKIVFLGSIPFLFLISSFTPAINESLIIKDGVYIQDAYGSLYFLYLIDIIFNLIASTYLAINKLKKFQRIEKVKMTIVSCGYLAFVTAAVLTNLILPLFGIMIIQEYSQLLILAFIIPTYYAIQKYRFLKISNVILSIFRKIVLCSIFLLSVFGFFVVTTYLFPEVNIIIIGLASALFGLLMLKVAEKVTPELVSKSFQEFQGILAEFRSKIYYCDSYTKFQKIIEDIFLLKLNMLSAKIYVVRKKGNKVDHIPVYAKDQFTEVLENYKKDVLIKEEIGFRKLAPKTKKILIKALEKIEINLCIPLFSEKKLIGFFALERKSGKSPYSKEEIEELLKVKKDLEICFMNALLKMNLQEENNLMKEIINKKTKELKRHFIEIKNLLNQQSDFIAVTAHELRTPLNIAMFQLEEVLESDKKPAELLKDLKIIDSSLGNLKNLTQKLFDVQQFDLKKVKLQK